MINLGWSDFKSQVLDTNNWPFIYFEVSERYFLFAKQVDFTVTCLIEKDSGADQTDFETNYKAKAATQLATQVTTQEEKNDKRLKLACGSADFISSDSIEISIKVPSGGRWIAGGYCWLDSYKNGDRVKSVSLVDVDNILGYGAEFVLANYHDTDMDTANQGWLMYPAPSGASECEIDPIGGYAYLPEGLYLEIYIARASGSSATFAAINLWWAKNE
jgi:hypothetical protein